MTRAIPQELKEALTEKLAESLAEPLPEATPRRVYGTVALPGLVESVQTYRGGLLSVG